VSSPVERVRKLIALTSSPEEAEAKNAAVQACALIRKHELVLVDPTSGDRPLEDGEESDGERLVRTFTDLFKDMQRTSHRSRKRGRERER